MTMSAQLTMKTYTHCSCMPGLSKLQCSRMPSLGSLLLCFGKLVMDGLHLDPFCSIRLQLCDLIQCETLNELRLSLRTKLPQIQ